MNYPKKEFCISLAVLMRLCARLAGPARRPQETAGFGAETDFLHCVQYATFSPTLGVQVGRVCSIVVGAARRTGRGGRRCNNASSEPWQARKCWGNARASKSAALVMASRPDLQQAARRVLEPQVRWQRRLGRRSESCGSAKALQRGRRLQLCPTRRSWRAGRRTATCAALS